MGETARDEELAVIVLRQFYGHVLPEGGRAPPHVYRHIQHTATDDAHQLGLRRLAALEVEAAHDAVAGAALIVLDEVYGCYELGEEALIEGLEEVAAGVLEEARLEDLDLVDSSV